MLLHSLRVGLKVLARRPFFTFVSLFGIALTLAVLTVATALLDHTFGSVAPEVHADRMLGIFQIEMSNGEGRHYRGEAGFSLLDRNLRGLELAEEMSLFTIPSALVTFVDGRKVPLDLRRVDGAFFRVLQFDFLEGGPLTDDDDADARPVAVISERARQLLFGNAPAVGQTFELDSQRLRVQGVVRTIPDFRPISAADVWVPIQSARSDSYRRGLTGRFQALLLARERSDLGALRSEVEGRLATVDPSSETEFQSFSTYVDSPFDALSRELLDLYGEEHAGLAPGSRMKMLIAVGMLLFMALPSLNLVNLNLSRILERVSEIGVRKSFGASSRALVAQFLVENLVLTLLGGALGFVFGALGLNAISGSAFVSYAELGLNASVFAWGLLLITIFALISGVYPAWRMSKLHPKEALEEKPS